MKKIFPALLLLPLFFFSQPAAFPHDETSAAASSIEKGNDMWVKLGRGLGNTFLGFFETAHQPAQMARTERWPIAFLGGFPKGILFGIWREALGVYEVVTFPIPVPAGYRPLIEPEFIIPSS